jgi:cell division protein ZapA
MTMTTDTAGIDIRLMDREFKVACPEGEEQRLLDSVDYLNQQIKEIKSTNRNIAYDRLVLLAALNITHEFLLLKDFDTRAVKRKIADMQATIDDVLAKQEKLF